MHRLACPVALDGCRKELRPGLHPEGAARPPPMHACRLPPAWVQTSGYQLARDTLSTLMFVWLLISMHGMTRCRTAGEKKARRKTGQHNGALASSPPSSHTPVGAAAPANGSALAAAAADEDNGDKGQRDSADAPAPAGDLAAAGPEAPGCAPAGPAAAAKLARTLSSAMYAGGTTFADSAAAAVGGAAAVPMAAAANALNYHPPRRTAAGLAAAEAAGALLVVDQPLGVQLRIHMPKLLAWGLLEGLVILSGVREVRRQGGPGRQGQAGPLTSQWPSGLRPWVGRSLASSG